MGLIFSLMQVKKHTHRFCNRYVLESLPTLEISQGADVCFDISKDLEHEMAPGPCLVAGAEGLEPSGIIYVKTVSPNNPSI